MALTSDISPRPFRVTSQRRHGRSRGTMGGARSSKPPDVNGIPLLEP
jgi:hypothetical protein